MQYRKVAKQIATLIWVGILIAFYIKTNEKGYNTAVFLQDLHAMVTKTEYGPIVYIVIYILRPIIFFPAAFLTMLSGALFGLWGGIIFTVIGENLSALLAYAIGLFLGHDFLNSYKMQFFAPWQKKINENHFMAVLTMRLIYLPFDLVNYACGAVGVRWKEYTLATFIGIIPGLVTFVSFGASLSIEEFLTHFSDFQASRIFNKQQIMVSMVLFATSLLIARIVHSRQKNKNSPANP
ncbi:MAG: TVP38/TMEM64 family protein [Nitrospiria bacterium]